MFLVCCFSKSYQTSWGYLPRVSTTYRIYLYGTSSVTYIYHKHQPSVGINVRTIHPDPVGFCVSRSPRWAPVTPAFSGREIVTRSTDFSGWKPWSVFEAIYRRYIHRYTLLRTIGAEFFGRFFRSLPAENRAGRTSLGCDKRYIDSHEGSARTHRGCFEDRPEKKDVREKFLGTV